MGHDPRIVDEMVDRIKVRQGMLVADGIDLERFVSEARSALDVIETCLGRPNLMKVQLLVDNAILVASVGILLGTAGLGAEDILCREGKVDDAD